MKNKKKYYKTTFEIEVLSEEPIDEINLEDLGREVIEGDCVLYSDIRDTEEFDGKEMADLLIDAGSEPGFFRLKDNGEEIS